MTATCFEYKCGCIIHSLAGALRRCPGMVSRSCSGKQVAKADNAENRHNNAMNNEHVRTYDVANIMP